MWAGVRSAFALPVLWCVLWYVLWYMAGPVAGYVVEYVAAYVAGTLVAMCSVPFGIVRQKKYLNNALTNPPLKNIRDYNNKKPERLVGIPVFVICCLSPFP